MTGNCLDALMISVQIGRMAQRIIRADGKPLKGDTRNREDRLRDKLRENLQRRKAQSRANRQAKKPNGQNSNNGGQ